MVVAGVIFHVPAADRTWHEGQAVMRVPRAIILSDIHLGPEGPAATFRDDVALAGFLDRLSEEPATPSTELVLAGDCFDFLQTPGYDGFSATRAVDRFDAILTAKRTKPVIAALRRFAGRPGHEITLLSGNHDPELLVDDVRRRFEEAIGRPGTVLHADDEPLWAAEPNKPPIWGRALSDGKIWVVHGDRWDPMNMINRSEVRSAVQAGRPVQLPKGSHLVFEVLEKIRPKHPWVDELKPEVGVFALLLYLDFYLTAAFLLKHYDISGAILRGKIQARLHLGSLFGKEGGAAANVTDVSDSLAALLAHEMHGYSAAQKSIVLAQIEARFDGERPPVVGTLAAYDVVPRLCLLAGVWWLRRRDRFQDPRGPDDIPDAASHRLPEHLAALIAGHTHGPRARPDLTPAYFNSGTWTPVGQIPAGMLIDRIDELANGLRWPANAPRTFVEVTLADVPRIQLCHCDTDGSYGEFG